MYHIFSDEEFFRATLMSGVFNQLPEFPTWAETVNSHIQTRLEKGTLVTLSKCEKIGRQEKSQIWVLGAEVQFRPNGSLIPIDMINQHHTDINVIKAISPVQGRFDPLIRFFSTQRSS